MLRMQEQPRKQVIVLGLLERDGAVLLSRRPPYVPQGGRWEFPGGKVEAGEDYPTALQREMQEEIGVTITVGEELATTSYRYPEIEVELHLFQCALVEGEPHPCEVAEVRWVAKRDLPTYAFPPANAALLAALGLS